MNQLIGITGRMGSGKDSIGGYLCSRYGYKRYAFADQLKALARAIGWSGEKDEQGRALLQNLGHGAREILGAQVWVRALHLKIMDDGIDPSRARVVVTDVRYPNEAAWVRHNGGKVWRVDRPELERVGDTHSHPTETWADLLPVDLTIVNDGDLPALFRKVDEAMGFGWGLNR